MSSQTSHNHYNHLNGLHPSVLSDVTDDFATLQKSEELGSSVPLVNHNKKKKLNGDICKKRVINNGVKQPSNVTNIAVLNAAACLDGCDDQLLPASFRALEAELKFHPSLLGKITLAQTMALSISCPFWGYMADRYSRKKIMTAGMVSWGLTTILLAFASRLWHIVALRTLNGIFLGSIGPISQSILADITPEMSRGFQFGLVQMCSSGGRVVGGVLTTSVALVQFGGLYGWRWTFLAVGFVSFFLGLSISLFVDEFSRPSQIFSDFNQENTFLEVRRRKVRQRSLGGGTGETYGEIQNSSISHSEELDATSQTGALNTVMSQSSYSSQILEPYSERIRLSPDTDENNYVNNQDAEHPSPFAFVKHVLSESFIKPSVLLILLEGIVGIIPWSAMSFLTMYCQYCGLSDLRAGIVASSVLIGAMISGPIGGIIGDKIFIWSPNHGRPFLGQLSMMFRIPLLLKAFLLVPQEPESFGILVIICLGIGLCSIAGVVVNRPLLSDVVRPCHRATTFALAVAIEGASGALLGAPLVGYLAEKSFGYIKTDKLLTDIPVAIRRNNAAALGQALFFLTTIPWIFSFFAYGFIHLTYGTDRENLQQKLYTESVARRNASGTGDTQPVRFPALTAAGTMPIGVY